MVTAFALVVIVVGSVVGSAVGIDGLLVPPLLHCVEWL
jgi:hypothetical protein